MQPLTLKEERERLYRRIAGRPISSPRFCPEAYQHTIERKHIRKPVLATTLIGALAALFMLVIFFVASAIFEQQVLALTETAEDLATPVEQQPK